jgi:hypothetical protein
MGQPLGLLQVLWERGLISEALLDNKNWTVTRIQLLVKLTYSIHFDIYWLSARTLLKEQEETALQYLGSQLGVRVQLTPKFHAELAGKGVEYCWAQAKSYYCRVPVSRKRGRENFKQLVRDKCTCPVNVLSKKRIQKFAARTRAYICTYHHLD